MFRQLVHFGLQLMKLAELGEKCDPFCVEAVCLTAIFPCEYNSIELDFSGTRCEYTFAVLAEPALLALF